MTALQRRVLKLETRLGLKVPAPWERPGWNAMSEAAQLVATEEHACQYPHSRAAQMLRALEAMTDAELEALAAEADAVLRRESGT